MSSNRWKLHEVIAHNNRVSNKQVVVDIKTLQANTAHKTDRAVQSVVASGEVPGKRNKYSNKKTEVDGISFDSKKEARQYVDLKNMQAAGIISDLILQKKFDIIINGKKVCYYKADFEYMRDGATIVLDVKGMKTPVYNLKKKLMKAVLGIDITEV